MCVCCKCSTYPLYLSKENVVNINKEYCSVVFVKGL